MRPEQRAYAAILTIAVRITSACMAAAFAVYILGPAPRITPMHELLPGMKLSVSERLDRMHAHGGWSWAADIGKAEHIALAGIALFAFTTVLCYAGILPCLVRCRDGTYTLICLAQIVILLLAASGLLAGH